MYLILICSSQFIKSIIILLFQYIFFFFFAKTIYSVYKSTTKLLNKRILGQTMVFSSSNFNFFMMKFFSSIFNCFLPSSSSPRVSNETVISGQKLLSSKKSMNKSESFGASIVVSHFPISSQLSRL